MTGFITKSVKLFQDELMRLVKGKTQDRSTAPGEIAFALQKNLLLLLWEKQGDE